MDPLLLPSRPIEHQYLGGELIAALRGGPGGPNRPEEWLGSTTTRFGSDSDGMTVIDGVPLRDLVESDPVGWLGAQHVKRFGSSTALLVKLLHAGQRLPVHLHPSQAFATSHLGCPFGKSEAWYVLDRDRRHTEVYVGTNRPVERAEWEELMAAQNSDAMLALMNPINVDVGHGIFVPSGTPHAIGEGLLIMELQEPTDFSILLEWDGFEFDGPNDGHLDLGFDVALGAIDPQAIDGRRLDELIRPTGPTDRTDDEAGSCSTVLPTPADPYFKLHRAAVGAIPNGYEEDAGVVLPHSFGVLLVTEGAGSMQWAGGSRSIQRGEAYVVPHGAGPVTLTGPTTPSGKLVALFGTPPDRCHRPRLNLILIPSRWA